MYFKAEEEISEILITVWKRKDKNEQWEIFYENSNQVLREIFTNFGITGFIREIEIKFTQQYQNEIIPKIKSRIIQLKIFNKHILKNLSKLSSYKFDPWCTSL